MNSYSIRIRLIAILILGTTVSFIGCGGNPLGREDVTGSVTLDGQPLDQGLISFEPKLRGEGHVGSGTSIKDGRYVIPANKGIPAGEYLVRIHSAVMRNGPQASVGKGEMPGTGEGGIGIERIPPQYNVRTKLSVTVTESGPNEFNFELKNR